MQSGLKKSDTPKIYDTAPDSQTYSSPAADVNIGLNEYTVSNIGVPTKGYYRNVRK